MEKQDLQAWEKWWQSSPVLQLTRSRSKKQKETDVWNIWIEKDGFKPGSRLDWKIVETFWSGHELNCDQLVDMHHTQNSLEKNRKTEFLQKN